MILSSSLITLIKSATMDDGRTVDLAVLTSNKLDGTRDIKELVSGLMDYCIERHISIADTDAMYSYLGIQVARKPAIQSGSLASGTSSVVLGKYGRCITDSSFCADPTIDRDTEIDACIRILCRRTKNNPLLIGPPGVGKTFIAYGIAERIRIGNVPSQIAAKRIYQIDTGSLLAGTIYRGQFESRVKEIIDAASDGNTILFIDEIHTIVGAGAVGEGSLDMSNMLKVGMADGTISVIGATTDNEYRKYLQRDAALDRRMQVVMVSEPDKDATYDMLASNKGLLEDYHNVLIPDDILRNIPKLAKDNIRDRYNPDASFDILDEASVLASTRIASSSKWYDKILHGNILEGIALRRQVPADQTVVTLDDVVKVVGSLSGNKVVTDDYSKLEGLTEHLASMIVGQDDAIATLVKLVRSAHVFSDPTKPMASLLFIGTSGSGKTYTAQCLADYLFDGKMLRLDMSEYSERFTVSRLVGSSPGYVGYDEGGILTNWVRNNPYSLILLDEIDKAHPDVSNILLSIMDYGKIADMLGRVAAFSNTVIIMTGNIGTEIMRGKRRAIGFGDPAANDTKELDNAISSTFRPEFIDRLSGIVRFNTLTRADMYRIIDLTLKRMSNSIDIDIDDTVREHLLDDWKEGTGARHIRKKIIDNITTPISDMILNGTGSKADKYIVRSDNGIIVVEVNTSEELAHDHN